MFEPKTSQLLTNTDIPSGAFENDATKMAGSQIIIFEKTKVRGFQVHKGPRGASKDLGHKERLRQETLNLAQPQRCTNSTFQKDGTFFPWKLAFFL